MVKKKSEKLKRISQKNIIKNLTRAVNNRHTREMKYMNIQIFGKNKCFESKSAERFFKERKIKYQYINLAEKGMSLRELDIVLAYVKDIDELFDTKSSLYVSLNVPKLRTVESKKMLLLANPLALKTPIVRDCDSKKCTVGAAEQIWKSWQQA